MTDAEEAKRRVLEKYRKAREYPSIVGWQIVIGLAPRIYQLGVGTTTDAAWLNTDKKLKEAEK